ncbi:MAG TPA: amino acid aminotransferase, partial [Burkholderiaceae bacterium]|nr:amino acid aminotransferase [Burkholderiaceae bacterium]
GVYYNEEGKIPLLEAARASERALADAASPKGYLPIEGLKHFNVQVQKLVLGADSPLLDTGRVITAQALGGTGALKIGADLLKRTIPDATVLISDPSWENHRALFEAAGFAVTPYPYYNPQTRGFNLEGMLGVLANAAPGSIVVLHACCHNPTGVDPTPEQWQQIVQVITDRELVPFLDMAYQGFGDGIEADGSVVGLFVQRDRPVLIANSFSKSFSLYGERVGALTIVAETAQEAQRVLSQLKRTIRSNYSNPPTHGASVVAAVLGDATLRSQWADELGQMRERIKQMRQALVDGLRSREVGANFDFVLSQRGMFSYSGLSAEQVERLKQDYAIYAVSTGRICVAALNTGNINAVCDALAAILKN